MPALAAMPCVQKDANSLDSEYPPLGWEAPAVSTMLRRSGQVEEWWTAQLAVAAFARVPVGSIHQQTHSTKQKYFKM